MLSILALVAPLLPVALCDPMWNGLQPISTNHNTGSARSLRLFGADLDVRESPQKVYEPPSQDLQHHHHQEVAGSSHPRLFGVSLDPFTNPSAHSSSIGGQESYHDDSYPGHQVYEAEPTTDPMSTTDQSSHHQSMAHNQDEEMEGYYDYQAGKYYPDLGYQEGDEPLEMINEEDVNMATDAGTEQTTGDGLAAGELIDGRNKDGSYTFKDLYDNFDLPTILAKKIVLNEYELRLLMEKHFPILRFNVIDPVTSLTEPVSVARGHGILHIIGGEETWKLFALDIERRFAKGKRLSKEEKLAKMAAQQGLKRSRQAMLYLCNQPRGGIYHEPSGKIFMSPLASSDDVELIQELIEKCKAGQLPKLRLNDMIHFKTSNQVKLQHRNRPLGRREKAKGIMKSQDEEKSIEDETSSQGEDTDMGENVAAVPREDYRNDFTTMEQAITRKARTKITRTIQNL